MEDLKNPRVVLSLAFVDENNHQLYSKTFVPSADDIHLLVYSALDNANHLIRSRSTGSDNKSNLLGVLACGDGMKVFGYVASTNHRIILVTKYDSFSEDKLNSFFFALNSLFIDQVNHPFRISTSSFDLKVVQLVEQYASRIIHRDVS